MKKLLTLAAMATLLMAGSVFAGGLTVAQPNATFAFGVGGAAAGPTTTNNDDTCDIAVEPAATLLLPYFEVETASRATDTFFTIINTSAYPQIAHVVVWTDWSYPVLDFNVFLTGYDVQPLSMYDIIVNGIIAPNPGSTTAGGTSSNSTPGSISNLNNSNPNFSTGAVAGCANLPGVIPGTILTNLQNALIRGTYSGCSGSVGSAASTHTTTTTAVGYVTVDVVSNCSPNMPDTAVYYQSDLLYDNVLTGDYEILNKATGSNYAGGNPLVHIRAVPEGGPAGAVFPVGTNATNLPYTFYSRYINGVTFNGVTYTGANLNYDRRQPLPATFAARYIQGGATSFNTSYRIWREGRTVSGTGCGTATTANNAVANSALPVGEVVRFDEHENPNVFAAGVVISPPIQQNVTFPETSTTSTANNNYYPTLNSPAGDVGGWMYLNLNSGAAMAFNGGPTGANAVNTALHPGFGPRPSQNFVIVSMTGSGSTAGLFGVDFDATMLGNGCSPAVTTVSLANSGSYVIGPAGGVFVCPQGDPSCTATPTTYTNLITTATGSAGTNVTP